VERFHLSVLLTLILLRNLIEHTNCWTTPLSLPWTDLCMPFVMVLGSELLVDWCKHAFVTKFNHIRPSVYGRFVDVLCLDFVKDGREVSFPHFPTIDIGIRRSKSRNFKKNGSSYNSTRLSYSSNNGPNNRNIPTKSFLASFRLKSCPHVDGVDVFSLAHVTYKSS
jgi:hypothetical protein